MSDWKQRLTETLEPILREQDPRPKISAYHDMPYAIFRFAPEAEFALRAEVSMLRTRLEHAGKRVTTVSLAQCLLEALECEGIDAAALAEAEMASGVGKAVETVHSILDEYRPLNEMVAAKLPQEPDPLRDVVFVARAGALFPAYRVSALLNQLQGKVHVPCVLFYPGVLEGAAGLSFMGVMSPEAGYRPRIF